MTAVAPHSAPRAVLRAQDLVVAYGSHRVLDGLALTLAPGESLAVLAPGGGGKSTLFRALLYLEQSQGGTLYWFDQSVTQLSNRQIHHLRQRIGAVHQNGALFADLTVEDNIRLPLVELTNLPAPQVDSTLRFILTVAHLTPFRHLRPAALSTLMIRQVALARALVLGPELLICDDIFAGLDPKAQGQICRSINALHLQRGRAALFLTHDLDMAIRLAQQLAVLRAGKIVWRGEAATLGSDPASRGLFAPGGPLEGALQELSQ